jgi:hypothetical protein
LGLRLWGRRYGRFSVGGRAGARYPNQIHYFMSSRTLASARAGGRPANAGRRSGTRKSGRLGPGSPPGSLRVRASVRDDMGLFIEWVNLSASGRGPNLQSPIPRPCLPSRMRGCRGLPEGNPASAEPMADPAIGCAPPGQDMCGVWSGTWSGLKNRRSSRFASPIAPCGSPRPPRPGRGRSIGH